MKIEKEEERFIFSILIALDIFLIATILYLTSFLHNGSIVAKTWILATVVTIFLAVILRIASNFVAPRFFKVIAYIGLAISIIFQLLTIFILLSA